MGTFATFAGEIQNLHLLLDRRGYTVFLEHFACIISLTETGTLGLYLKRGKLPGPLHIQSGTYRPVFEEG